MSQLSSSEPDEKATLANRAVVKGMRSDAKAISIVRLDAPMKLPGSAALSVLTTN